MDSSVVAGTISCPCVADSLMGFVWVVIVPAAMVVIAAIIQARRSARRPSEDLPPDSHAMDSDDGVVP